MHTWGGRPHDSQCRVTIEPDGKVAATLGSQDLGPGSRTVIGIVLAETMGLPLSQVTVNIGDSRYPPSGASGGSTTTGGVSSSTRRGAVLALDELKKAVAPDLGVSADELEAKDGTDPRQGQPQQVVELETGLRQAGFEDDLADRRAAHARRRQAGRPGRRRRSDGRCLGRPRDRHRQDEQDGRRAGLRPDHRPENGREPGLRRHDHGHLLVACGKSASTTK